MNFVILNLVILCLVCFHSTAGLSNAGKVYFQTFNFNDPSVEHSVLHAFVLSTHVDQCEILITVDAPPLTVFNITISNTEAVVYPIDVESTRGIKLEASCDFVAYGLNFAPESADGWMAMPVEALGTEYVVLSVEPWLKTQPTQLTIVAAYNNTICTCIFPNGTQNVTELNEIEVQYYTSDQDFTGTQISCNQKVTVLTGQRCSFIPQGCGACDHTVEQVPPKSTLGRNFAMVPLFHKCKSKPSCCSDPLFCTKCTEIYRILAIENDTYISRNGTETSENFTLGAGESRYILLSQTEFSLLVSTKPVLLGHYFNGQYYEGDNEDPAFGLIPQIESYAQRYQAATCYPQFQHHFLNLVIPKGTSGQLLLNGKPFLDPKLARRIPYTNLDAYQYQWDCSKGSGKPISFVLEHSQNATFGMFAYGFSSWISYGYPGGMKLDEDGFFKYGANWTAPQVQQCCDRANVDINDTTPDSNGNETRTSLGTTPNNVTSITTAPRSAVKAVKGVVVPAPKSQSNSSDVDSNSTLEVPASNATSPATNITNTSLDSATTLGPNSTDNSTNTLASTTTVEPNSTLPAVTNKSTNTTASSKKHPCNCNCPHHRHYHHHHHHRRHHRQRKHNRNNNSTEDCDDDDDKHRSHSSSSSSSSSSNESGECDHHKGH